MQLNPMHLKVSGLMNGRLFRIPEYQRGYAWGARQREDLFNDILNVDRSGREHFMATVVALAKDSRTIGADEFRAVELVDGQQRITSLGRFITNKFAIKDENGMEQYFSGIAKDKQNKILLSLLQQFNLIILL